MTLCHVFGVHRSSYRQWRARSHEPDVKRLIQRSQVKEAWNASKGSAGARSIASMVTTASGVKMGRWLAAKLMKELNICSCQIPKHKRSGSEHVEIPNLLDRQFAVSEPNQVWCGDVTYIWTGKSWAYLAVVMDLFARKPVGWALSTSPDSSLTVKALQMAWELRGRPIGLMFHSDQGSHYTSRQYRQALWRCQITQSMSRRGNCHDNAVVESFFNLLKRERVRRRVYKTRDEARQDVFDYIEMFYNPKRKHVRNGMLSPVEYERRQKISSEGV